MSNRALVRLVAPAVIGLSLLAAMPGASSASCIPPRFQAFVGAADTVVIEGGIVDVEPGRVIVDASRWWGEGPTQRVAIDRTSADPTVISSVDWNPQPGERWVIIARRQGDRLGTGVCEQMPADQLVLAEVRSSLGDGIVPQPAAEPVADTGVSPILIAGLIAFAAAVVVGLALARRRVTPS